jgi:hypothetical protein
MNRSISETGAPWLCSEASAKLVSGRQVALFRSEAIFANDSDAPESGYGSIAPRPTRGQAASVKFQGIDVVIHWPAPPEGAASPSRRAKFTSVLERA